MKSQSSSDTMIDRDLEGGIVHPDANLEQAPESLPGFSPAQFERVFLSPKTQVAGELRYTFANPAPLALLGFSVAMTPLSTQCMGWRGAGGFAAATTSASIWYGGFLLVLAGIGEFLLGNNFTFIVFMAYGCHFLTIATTFIPWFNAVGFYNGGGPPSDVRPQFYEGFGFYTIALMVLSFIFMIGSLRTNAIFVLVFALATVAFGMDAAADWALAAGEQALGRNLVFAVGVCLFICAICGWYLLLANVIAVMELPIPDLPIFDLSTVVKARPRTTRKIAEAK